MILCFYVLFITQLYHKIHKVLCEGTPAKNNKDFKNFDSTTDGVWNQLYDVLLGVNDEEEKDEQSQISLFVKTLLDEVHIDWDEEVKKFKERLWSSPSFVQKKSISENLNDLLNSFAAVSK